MRVGAPASTMWPCGCRIFVEPQQGASYETLRAAAKGAEDAGFDAFFRSDHYLKMGGADGLPGPTDAWTTLAGLARDTTTHPARHARHVGHVPAPRTARDHRRPGRRDERRPRGARLGGRVVRGGARRLRDPLPIPRRAVRPPRRAAVGDRRAVDDAGGRDVQRARAPLRVHRQPGAAEAGASGPTRRSSSAAAARAVPRASRRRSPRSTTRRSSSPTTPGGLRARRRGVRGHRPRPRDAAAQRRGHGLLRDRRRAGRPSRGPRRLEGRATQGGRRLRDARRGRRAPRAVARRRRQVAYLQLLDPGDLDHIELLGSAVAPKL